MKQLRFEKKTEEEDKKNEEEFHSRPEYINGEIPFTYKHAFLSGETLEAFQEEDGTGHVVIKKKGETVFDFFDLLPPDFVMAAPGYFKTFPEKKEAGEDDVMGQWGTSIKRKLIFLGDFKSLKNIASLLHEMGHVNNNSVSDYQERMRLIRLLEEKSIFISEAELSMTTKELARIKSKTKREAWAWALRTMRETQKKLGVDLFAAFPTFSAFKEYINGSLATYRRSYEWIIKQGYDEDFYKELEKLFDRWKYASDAEKIKKVITKN